SAERGLAIQIRPPDLSAGKFCRLHPLPRHLLPGRQLAVRGPNPGTRPSRSRPSAADRHGEGYLPLSVAPPVSPEALGGGVSARHPSLLELEQVAAEEARRYGCEQLRQRLQAIVDEQGAICPRRSRAADVTYVTSGRAFFPPL